MVRHRRVTPPLCRWKVNKAIQSLRLFQVRNDGVFSVNSVLYGKRIFGGALAKHFFLKGDGSSEYLMRSVQSPVPNKRGPFGDPWLVVNP